MLVEGSVSLRKMDQVIGSLIKQTMFPIPVSKKIFIEFYRKMIQRVFVPKDDSAFKQDLLSNKNFEQIRSEMQIVHEIIAALEFGFNGVDPNHFHKSRKDAYDESLNVRGRIAESIKRSIEKWNKNGNIENRENSEKLFLALTDFDSFNPYSQSDFNSYGIPKGPSVHFSNGYILSRNYLDYKNTWIGHFRGFYTRTLARLLISGWGDRKANSIDGKGLSQWYADFKSYALALKVFDPRTGNGGERSLLEANLFTIDGNGDDQVSYREAVQYIAMLTTGGGTQFKHLWDLLEKNQCLTSDPDPLGLYYVKENCAVTVLATHHNSLFYNMNGFNSYLSGLGGPMELSHYFQSVLDVARSEVSKKGQPIESGELRTAIMLINYVESIFTALNTEDSTVAQRHTLSIQELRVGYPRFEKLIFDFAKETKGEKLDWYARNIYDIKFENSWKAFLGEIMTYTSSLRCRDNGISKESNERLLARDTFIFLLLNGHMDIKPTDFLSSCLLDRTPIRLEGEVDRLELIYSFKVLKPVLASGQ